LSCTNVVQCTCCSLSWQQIDEYLLKPLCIEKDLIQNGHLQAILLRWSHASVSQRLPQRYNTHNDSIRFIHSPPLAHIYCGEIRAPRPSQVALRPLPPIRPHPPAENVLFSTLDVGDSEMRARVAEYMKTEFYGVAVIPLNLGLKEKFPDFVQSEMGEEAGEEMRGRRVLFACRLHHGLRPHIRLPP